MPVAISPGKDRPLVAGLGGTGPPSSFTSVAVPPSDAISFTGGGGDVQRPAVPSPIEEFNSCFYPGQGHTTTDLALAYAKSQAHLDDESLSWVRFHVGNLVAALIWRLGCSSRNELAAGGMTNRPSEANPGGACATVRKRGMVIGTDSVRSLVLMRRRASSVQPMTLIPQSWDGGEGFSLAPAGRWSWGVFWVCSHWRPISRTRCRHVRPGLYPMVGFRSALAPRNQSSIACFRLPRCVATKSRFSSSHLWSAADRRREDRRRVGQRSIGGQAPPSSGWRASRPPQRQRSSSRSGDNGRRPGTGVPRTSTARPERAQQLRTVLERVAFDGCSERCSHHDGVDLWT